MPEDKQLVQFICSLNNPDSRLDKFIEALTGAIKSPGNFALCVGSTATSDLEGISAAGADGESRRLTPAIDAEALALGKPVSAKSLPVSPKGVVSPVVLSRAMLNLLGCSIDVFDCGAFYPPKMNCTTVSSTHASRIDSGAALELSVARRLFTAGEAVGKQLALKGSYVIIGECVPGGTTTALGVLTALGYDAGRLVSSSMPSADHERRRKLVSDGLLKSGLTHDSVNREPLLAVSAVGDPMQPFACGVALGASSVVPVILGGGSQMLAVWALARAIVGVEEMRRRTLGVITTKWVAFDSGADVAALAKLVDAPFAASCPDFNQSRHNGLRLYEDGNVKEGVGAGALMALASLSGFDEQKIRHAIDVAYDAMVIEEAPH